MMEQLVRVWGLALLVGVLEPVVVVARLGLPGAVVLAQPVVEQLGEAIRLNSEGEKLKLQGEWQAALEKYEQALAIVRSIGERQSEGAVLNNIGSINDSLGQPDKALGYYQQALIIEQELGNRQGEAVSLNNIGLIYYKLSQYDKALGNFQQALAIQQEVGDRQNQWSSLSNIGSVYDKLGQYGKALDYYQQSLAIIQELGNRQSEGILLNNIGFIYNQLSQYNQALDYFQQALVITQASGDRQSEAIFLNNIGDIYASLAEYNKALSFFQQSIAIQEDLGDRRGKATSLNNIGDIYISLAEYNKALSFFQRSLAIKQELGERQSESISLNNIGQIYDNLGQYNKALDYYQQSLAIDQELGDRRGEGISLNNIGNIYDSLGQYDKALDSYQQSLMIRKAIDDRRGEAIVLNNIGITYNNQGQYDKALDYYQQSLAIREDIGDRQGEAGSLNNIGSVYDNLGQYGKALSYYQQTLTIDQELSDRRGEAGSLNNIGGVYNKLGQYDSALDYYQQALAILQEIGARQGQAGSLNNIGRVYKKLGQSDKTLGYHQQALAIDRELGDRRGEGLSLSNIGRVYDSQGEYNKALVYYQQALAIQQEIGDRYREGISFNNIGNIYDSLGQYDKALTYYQQALAIHQALGDRENAGTALNNIAYTFNAQNQLQLATLFYKQSVSTYETIRADLRQLPLEKQKSYTKTVESTYRTLADLLLQQDRILEAQQVLDLLKVQELEDYLQNTRSSDTDDLIILKPEQEILDRYQTLLTTAIALGQEITQLQQKNRTQELSPAETDRLTFLFDRQTEINNQFNTFLKSNEIAQLIDQLKTTEEAVPPEQFDDLRRHLSQIGNAALFYPLILDDRLELILTTASGAPLRRSVNVSRSELNATILELRQALQDPSRDAKAPAQKLHQWLIQPIQDDLSEAEIKTLLYAPDGQLRYIPLAALYDENQPDGKRWLVQRFQVNNITASSLTKFGTASQPALSLLAGAFADTSISHTVTAGKRSLDFRGLPFAGREVELLKQTLPQARTFFDSAFSLSRLKPQMNGFSIVHLATHAAFVPGEPEDSFILFGDGSTANLRDIENWDLQNVDLVVLSACETGVGIQALGQKALGEGKEVLGLGYQFQNRGARATLASLWQVDDGGTQLLMDTFYAALKQGITKAEALQAAQQALISSDDQTVGIERAGIEVVSATGKAISDTQLSHPYYWAPFILIGNGL